MQIFNLSDYKFFFKKRYIPYGRQHITNKDIKNVLSFKDLITQGEFLDKFEDV